MVLLPCATQLLPLPSVVPSALLPLPPPCPQATAYGCPLEAPQHTGQGRPSLAGPLTSFLPPSAAVSGAFSGSPWCLRVHGIGPTSGLNFLLCLKHPHLCLHRAGIESADARRAVPWQGN